LVGNFTFLTVWYLINNYICSKQLKNHIMKKVFLTLALASFVGATTMSASTFGDDKKGDDKNKKECKKGGKSCCKKSSTTAATTTTDKK
jgi:hypothetical protein